MLSCHPIPCTASASLTLGAEVSALPAARSVHLFRTCRAHRSTQERASTKAPSTLGRGLHLGITLDLHPAVPNQAAPTSRASSIPLLPGSSISSTSSRYSSSKAAMGSRCSSSPPCSAAARRAASCSSAAAAAAATAAARSRATAAAWPATLPARLPAAAELSTHGAASARSLSPAAAAPCQDAGRRSVRARALAAARSGEGRSTVMRSTAMTSMLEGEWGPVCRAEGKGPGWAQLPTQHH